MIINPSLAVRSADTTYNDDVSLLMGTGGPVEILWETADANANELLIQLPAGGAVDVPVIIIGQAIENVDAGLYNGVVDPRIAIFGTGAVTTGPVVEFRKARGTFTSPTVVTTGDDLGTIDFYGAVAAGEYVRAASIRADMAGTIATTRGPGTITFLTATDAAPSVLTEAFRLTAAQGAVVASGLTVTAGGLVVTAGGATVDGGLTVEKGTSNDQSQAILAANVNNTAVGNVDAGEDDLITYSLPANSLSANGKGVRIRAWGTAANNANAKTLKVYFGTQVILTTSLTINQVDTWKVEATVWRTGASTQDWETHLIQAGTTTLVDVENGTATQTDTAAITIKCTGEAVATNDIVNEGLTVEFFN